MKLPAWCHNLAARNIDGRAYEYKEVRTDGGERMNLPEWLTARNVDGKIYGCKEGGFAYWHEVGHNVYKENIITGFFQVLLGCGLTTGLFYYIVFSWEIALKLGLACIVINFFADEGFASVYAIWKLKTSA